MNKIFHFSKKSHILFWLINNLILPLIVLNFTITDLPGGDTDAALVEDIELNCS